MVDERRRPFPERTRDKIKASMLVNRLQKHALGEEPMKASEIRSATVLLDRVLPKMKALEVKANVNVREGKELSDEELEAIAAGGGKGAPET